LRLFDEYFVRSLNNLSFSGLVEDKLVLDIPGEDDIFLKHLNILLYAVH